MPAQQQLQLRARLRHQNPAKQHVTTPEEQEAARVVGVVLWFIVGSQYGLYVWKKRNFASYQKTTLVGVWMLPMLFCLYHYDTCHRFLAVWLLYSLATGYFVRLTQARPLPRDTPARVYGWFNSMHKMSHALVVTGYVLALLDFNGVNPGALLVLFAPASWGLQRTYPPPPPLTASLSPAVGATDADHQHQQLHHIIDPSPWPEVWVRAVLVMCILYGVYFGILTRDVAEVATTQLSAALGLSKKHQDDKGGEDMSEWTRKNTCALCGEECVPLANPSAAAAAGGGAHLLHSHHHQRAQSEEAANALKRANQAALMNHPALSAASASSSSSPSSAQPPRKVPRKPEALFTLKCGHTFHESCLRGWSIVGKQNTCPYCVAPVDLGRILGSSPWQKQSLVWIHLLDAVRYLLVWHPLILAAAHFSVVHILGYHPILHEGPHDPRLLQQQQQQLQQPH